MKTLFTIASLLVATSGFATEKPLNISNKIITEVASSSSKFEINLYRIKDKMAIRLFINQKDANKLTIKLKDEKGNVLVSESTKKAGTTGFNFDISDLQNGEYNIEVSNGMDVITKKINITDEKVPTNTIFINQ